jgi:hypothetical protein
MARTIGHRGELEMQKNSLLPTSISDRMKQGKRDFEKYRKRSALSFEPITIT